MRASLVFGALVAYLPFVAAVSTQTYTYKSVKLGGGGGFVPGIVFNPKEKGLAYARTDIGGAYKLNADDTWSPLLDFADDARWGYWGVDALATDPVAPAKLYLAVGMYTNSWDPNKGSILRSSDYGKTWAATALPFKVGGNMPGRGMGERLAIDPNLNSILYFGARSGNGLWKSTDSGVTWAKVTAFPSVGTYVQDSTDANGYASDIQGIAWVTFDTSGTAGTATSRIFVGVANLNTTSVYVSTNAGSSWSALSGQPTTNNIPHKGVLSPAERSLYITYNNQGGPYDGTTGSVQKYNITSGVWTNITPPNPSALPYGFGGLAVDLQKPGTIMVSTMNSWWPDGNIFRSIDGGKTWSVLWEWTSYPTIAKYYTYDVSLAPWIGVTSSTETKQIGWMMECLVINPFDSNHWLYGTGLTIYGGRDLLKWDTSHMVTLKSLADGIEETAVLGLISPPTGPNLLSAVGDVGGFVHANFAVAPTTPFNNPLWGTTLDIDYAGNKPTNVVRIGSDTSGTTKQVAISTDSGATWSQDYGAADGIAGGKVAFSADGDTVLWRTGSNGVQVSRNTNAFTAVSSLPSGAVIASDKKNNAVFYAANGNTFYLSSDNGVTFAAKGTLGSSAYPARIVVNPGVTGDVWVSSDTGLFHSVNSGTSFTTIPGFTQAWSIALGAPQTTGGYPAVFAIAKYSGVTGYFRSDDQGVNWIQINEVTHGFGAVGSNVIAGDPRVYGRVYIGTNGRGIFYGDATGTKPPATTTGASTSVVSTSTVKTTSTSTIKTSSTSTKPTTSTSTIKSSTSSTKTSSSAAPSSTVIVPKYGQCGGSGWTGGTICAAGSTCTYSNDFYSQCL